MPRPSLLTNSRRSAHPLRWLALVFPLLLACVVAVGNAGAQGRGQRGAQGVSLAARDDSAAADSTRAGRDTANFRVVMEKPAVVTHHEMTLNGQTIRYTAYTGMMPIRNAQTGITEGHIFYVYYAKDGANPSTRPISFLFNGGPGSATVWLHMGAFGPRVVRLNPDGTNAPPPYAYADNPNTLLDQTDLVFLDPVGTGYSRATKPEYGKNFWGVDEDVKSVGEFMRLFLVKYQRWGSPKFIGGESYGTTRAAHLSGWLIDNGIALNGVVLISSMALQIESPDERLVGFFPSYTAISWYHKKLPADLQALPLEQVVAQAEQFADNQYLVALRKGNRLTPTERQQTIDQIARLTGLSPSFIAANDLRIDLSRYDHELLRDRGLMVGRLDGRFTGHAEDPGSERNDFDPSEASIRNSFTPVLNEYVQRELNYRNDDIYYVLGGGIGPWNTPPRLEVRTSLERAFNKNPDMRLYVAMGYYDTACPFWNITNTLAHLHIDPDVARHNITTDHFAAGHMMYIDGPSMKKLRADLRTFIDDAMRHPATVTAAGEQR